MFAPVKIGTIAISISDYEASDSCLLQNLNEDSNINAREYRRGNQKRTIQGNWQT
jgi:hypothetical protein